MQHIPDSRIKDLSVKYAELEMTLGEIDRARAIFQYGSQHCDPGKVSMLTCKCMSACVCLFVLNFHLCARVCARSCVRAW